MTCAVRRRADLSAAPAQAQAQARGRERSGIHSRPEVDMLEAGPGEGVRWWAWQPEGLD